MQLSLGTAIKNIFPWLIIVSIAAVTLSVSRSGDNFLSAAKLTALLMGSSVTAIICVIIGGILLLKGQAHFALKTGLADMILIIWLLYISIRNYQFQGEFGNDKFQSIFTCLLFYFTIRVMSIFKGPINARVISRGISLINIFVAFICLLQLFAFIPSYNEYFQVTGTFKNPAPLALFCTACFPFAMMAILYPGNYLSRIIALIHLITSTWIIFTSGNRASWVALVTICLIMLESKYRWVASILDKLKASIWEVVAAGFFIAVLAAFAFFYLHKIKSDSSYSRLFIWEVTIKHIADHPWTGYGYGSFSQDYNKWQSAYFIKHADILNVKYGENTAVADITGYIKMAYNEYLEMLAEQGIIGFVIFAAFIVIVLYQSNFFLKTKPDILFSSCFYSVLAILITGLFSYPFYSQPTLFLFFIMLAILTSGYQSSAKIGQNAQSGKGVLLLLFLFGLFLGYGFKTLQYTLQRFYVFQRYEKARILFRQNDLDGAERIYRESFPLLSRDPDFLVDYSSCLIADKKDQEAYPYLLAAAKKDNNPRILILAGNILERRDDYAGAESYYFNASLIIPSRIYPKYLLVKLYQKSNQLPKALKLANVIVNSKLKIQSDLSDKITLEMDSLLNSNSYSQLP